eukprot:682129-Pyramimonas_sp.AAC.1
MAAFVGRPQSALCHAVQAPSLPGRSCPFDVSRELRFFFSGFWAQRGASLFPLEALLGRRSGPGRCATVVHSRCEFCRGLG